MEKLSDRVHCNELFIDRNHLGVIGDMNNLTVLDFAGKGIRFERRGDRVWVSLTDMAQATGKLVGGWNRLEGTKEYLAKLESVMQIRITDTVQGGNPENQGTWGIEEVAIKFAMWCNVEFEIWVTQQIKTLMKEGTVSITAISVMEPPKAELTPAKLDLLRSSLSSLSPALVDGMLLNVVQRYHPELKPDIEAAHSLLAANTPIDEILLTPTAIGKQLGVSAKVVNALLTANGYQVKNESKGKTEPAYCPTEKGEAYSSNTIATGRGSDNTSYQHTKWKQSIIEVLRELI